VYPQSKIGEYAYHVMVRIV